VTLGPRLLQQTRSTRTWSRPSYSSRSSRLWVVIRSGESEANRCHNPSDVRLRVEPMSDTDPGGIAINSPGRSAKQLRKEEVSLRRNSNHRISSRAQRVVSRRQWSERKRLRRARTIRRERSSRPTPISWTRAEVQSYEALARGRPRKSQEITKSPSRDQSWSGSSRNSPRSFVPPNSSRHQSDQLKKW